MRMKSEIVDVMDVPGIDQWNIGSTQDFNRTKNIVSSRGIGTYSRPAVSLLLPA